MVRQDPLTGPDVPSGIPVGEEQLCAVQPGKKQEEGQQEGQII